MVDYFIWEELQIAENVEGIFKPKAAPPPVEKVDHKTSTFIHNEVRDKLRYIGRWLGLQADTEVKVADGAKVDATWQATIATWGGSFTFSKSRQRAPSTASS